jgi:hypothetical protein
MSLKIEKIEKIENNLDKQHLAQNTYADHPSKFLVNVVEVMAEHTLI